MYFIIMYGVDSWTIDVASCKRSETLDVALEALALNILNRAHYQQKSARTHA